MDCQRVEQVTTGRRGCIVNQYDQEQAGSTLAQYGHFKLTGYTTQPINLKYNYNAQYSPYEAKHADDTNLTYDCLGRTKGPVKSEP